ncbi:MAG TPA: acetoacetate--CoA ligase [Dongiaceae bacterium]|nr:acetoacetate--CoA ligase [Dongiaceae bacterium]
MNQPLWSPSAQRIQSTRLTAWQQWLAQKKGVRFDDYSALHQWTFTHRQDFWQSIADYFEVKFHALPTAVLENDVMPGARWFPGATLNFAEHLLRHRGSKTAIIGHLENGARREVSYDQLRLDTGSLAHWLKAQGVGAGDRVVGILPNIPETVTGMLATVSLGGIWSSCSPDFGVQGLLDRFGQVEPTILICSDGYFYNGKQVDCRDKIAALVAQLPSVKQVLVVPVLNTQPDLAPFKQALHWSVALSNPREPEFVPQPFAHPLYIMYSSGTTGMPKCIVHSAGGTLLQHLKEHALHTDLTERDVLFYYTTCGWMMWNWLVSGLALGATLVLYDGSPAYPKADVLWDIAESEKISIFGTSAKYIASLQNAGCKPRETHLLPQLKSILSTGSPLANESFRYVYRDIKEDVCLSSISGGTDIISCFALGNPNLPVYEGELQCKGLGMAVDIFDEDGRSVLDEKGELVCTSAFPSMPIGFWNDPEGKKYQSAYFSRFAGIWAHGDFAEQRPNGGMVIHGRSDTVLNPGGVRIGTAEIYRQVEKLEPVLESIAIGQEWQDDVRVVLFVKLRPGLTLDEELQKQIKTIIRDNTTIRHVPARILQVSDMPRTVNGKLVEIAVRDVVHGRKVNNLNAIANPEVLEEFRNRPELQA